MTEENTIFTPADEFIINDLETLKVVADPLRLNIIEFLTSPKTVKEVAEKIDKPPTKLYYHFNLLEKHNLIQMVFTRIVSGIVEKHYVATAYLYRLADGLLAPGNSEFEERLEVILSGLYGSLRNDMRESLKAGVIDFGENAPPHRRLKLLQGTVYLSQERADEFYQRLETLIKEFGMVKYHEPVDESLALGKQPYTFLLAWHPSSRETKK
jgi:DNA-binding transcriptional ArsR family regulator